MPYDALSPPRSYNDGGWARVAAEGQSYAAERLKRLSELIRQQLASKPQVQAMPEEYQPMIQLGDVAPSGDVSSAIRERMRAYERIPGTRDAWQDVQAGNEYRSDADLSEWSRSPSGEPVPSSAEVTLPAPEIVPVDQEVMSQAKRIRQALQDIGYERLSPEQRMELWDSMSEDEKNAVRAVVELKRKLAPQADQNIKPAPQTEDSLWPAI